MKYGVRCQSMYQNDVCLCSTFKYSEYWHIQNIDKNFTEYWIDKIRISMTPLKMARRKVYTCLMPSKFVSWFLIKVCWLKGRADTHLKWVRVCQRSFKNLFSKFYNLQLSLKVRYFHGKNVIFIKNMYIIKGKSIRVCFRAVVNSFGHPWLSYSIKTDKACFQIAVYVCAFTTNNSMSSNWRFLRFNLSKILA